MTRRRHQVFDARGRPVDDDVVPDGGWVRTPMWAMDGVQREIAADARRRKVVELDPMGRVRSTFEEEEEIEEDATTIDAAMHRPGYRTARVSDAAAHTAYDEYVRGLTDSWRTTDQPAPHVGPREGDPCMTDDKEPSRWQRRGDALVCVPDNNRIDFDTASTTVPRMMDEASAQAIRDAAYLQMCNELINAWRTK
jgi:hypothetical protein